MPLDSSFALRLRPFDRDTLDAATATICGVDHDFRIRYVNPAWSRFAEANGAVWKLGEWGIGAQLFGAIPRALRGYFERLFDDVIDGRTPAEYDYECSSPTEFRHFRMRVLPCERGALVLEHSVIVELPGDDAEPAILERYRTEADLLVQCAHCRRLRRSEEGLVYWDWVPVLAAKPRVETSHSLCEICSEFYFPA